MACVVGKVRSHQVEGREESLEKPEKTDRRKTSDRFTSPLEFNVEETWLSSVFSGRDLLPTV